MKKISTLIVAALISMSVWAQSPEMMSYQAVVRDASNVLVTNQSVGIQISILQGSATGTAVYVETSTSSTNSNGLVSIEIGAGTVVSGTFATIDWSAGPYFIMTETDPTGGTTYTITGTSQLMSVPYALYAKTSGSSTPGPEGSQGIQGVSGADGIDGSDGPAGTDGVDGATGPAGNDGADGATGLQGEQGIQGIAGTDGATGLQGIQGIAGNDGAVGPQGIAGNNGADGTDGAQGIQGIAGDNGTNGADGATGAKGDIGNIGDMGIAGNNGTDGATGIQGVPGVDGADGQNALDDWTLTGSDVVRTTGSVGIGTQNPNFLLHLHDNNTGAYQVFTDGQTGTSGIDGFQIGISGNQEARLINREDTPMEFWTNNTIRMVIAKTGNVGIGVQIANAKLQVKQGDIYIESVGKGIILRASNGACFRVTVNGDGTFASAPVTCP